VADFRRKEESGKERERERERDSERERERVTIKKVDDKYLGKLLTWRLKELASLSLSEQFSES
jgi:hypothetical protein